MVSFVISWSKKVGIRKNLSCDIINYKITLMTHNCKVRMDQLDTDNDRQYELKPQTAYCIVCNLIYNPIRQTD